MIGSIFVRKIRMLAFCILLCLSTMCMCACIFSLAHAVPPTLLESGTSGSCIWKYEKINNDIVFTVEPANGIEGTLDQPMVYNIVDENEPSGRVSGFPWNRSAHCGYAKRAVVKGKVKTSGSAAYFFRDFHEVESIDLSGLDITGVTNMEGMFCDCYFLTSLNVRDWNVSKVTNMSWMFEDCSALHTLDVSKWNVANVTTMEGMFFNCGTLSLLSVSGWNVANVTTMADMFFGCQALTSLDLSKWKPSNKVDTNRMFKETWCLGRISFGTNFYVNDDSGFNEAGSHIGANWMQVNLGMGGTHEDPKGKVFETPSELIAFHRDRTKRETDVEEYVRVTIPEPSEYGEISERERISGIEMDSGSEEASGSKEVSVDETSASDPVYQEPAREENVSKRSSSSWHEHHGQISYVENGKKLTGWQNLSGTRKDSSSTAKNWFCFDKNGVMLTGRRKLVGGKPNAQGKTEERWFYFDKKTGQQVRGWVKDRKGAWYYYSKEDGAGLGAGRHEIEGGNDGGKHWFCFDEKGKQVRGWSPIGTTWYYYSEKDGTGLVGQHELAGGSADGKHWFYFDEKTGAQIRGWKYIDHQNKWCYYSNADGAMLKGQHELVGGDKGGKHWFYFDEETGAELRNCWKKIPSQKKTCYYGPDGAMYKGWRRVGRKNFYFDKETGARR